MAKNSNLKPLYDAIRDASGKIEAKELERKAVADAIDAVRSDLETKGIGRKAFKMASDYIAMNENERRSFDLAYTIVREALGAPLQPDLFDTLETMTPEDVAASGAVDGDGETEEDQ